MFRARFEGIGWGFPGSLALRRPLEERIVAADAPEELEDLLVWLDGVAASGHERQLAAGFLTYEAGVWLEGSKALFRPPDRTPLAAFGLFDAQRLVPAAGDTASSPPGGETASPSLDRDGWGRAIAEIRDGIARGDVYQVNLTRRERVARGVSPEALAAALYADSPVPYAVRFEDEGWAVISNSPELFLSVDLRARTAVSAPIKGTIARPPDAFADDAARRELLASRKDAAEHVMIVDLVRNDLGRVAVPGGVDVPRFRRLLTLRHLHHLETTVRARLAKGVKLRDVLGATLPAGSITGAPKRAALGFIRRLEPTPRGPYTGALGWVRGDGTALFSVGIRTAVVSRAGGVEYHSGGGIVWDSDAAAEWEETLTKSREMAAAVTTLGVPGAA